MQTQRQTTDGGQFPQRLQRFEACIDACLACAKTCQMCAAACLGEPNVDELRQCIRLNEECALFCAAAASIMAHGSDYAQALCQLCAEICDACAAECGKHQTQHCQSCAQTCKSCADECRTMAGGRPQRGAGTAEAA